MASAEIVVYWDSKHGEIRLVKDEEGKLALFIDGALQFHEDSERRYHEALFTIPAHMVEKEELSVLVLGGGDGLGARNLLELPFVKEITLVDLSPEVISVALWEAEMRKLNRDSLHSPKVKIQIGDAFFKVKEFKGQKKFDLIILDYPDVPPVKGHQISRLYSREHFEDVKALLEEGGVVAVQAGSFSALPVYTEYILRLMRQVFGRGFTARVILKGFPDSTFYYSSAVLKRPLPEKCFTDSLDKIKAFLYRDEEERIKRNLPYVRDAVEAVIADFRGKTV